MADEKGGKDDGLGPFELGRSYDEVEPGLGRLHEAWHAKTGRPALRFFPTDRVEWQPSARWEALVVCEGPSPEFTILVNQAPQDVPTKELGNVLVLTAAAITRVEDNPRLRAHLASGLNAPAAKSEEAPPTGRQPRRHVVAGFALVLVLGLTSRHVASVWSVSSEADLEVEAPAAVYMGDEIAPAVFGYAIPQKPFRNQVTAPCPRRKSVVEINGGCWVTLEHKAPCEEDQGEHQGKCYLPVAKSPPLPRSSEP
jgi:hypothetical protein